MRVYCLKPGERILGLLAWLLVSTSVLMAQANPSSSAPRTLGTLRGQITDPSGAVVPGATVTARGSEGMVRVAATNDEGRYVISGLPDGKYTVSVLAKGFVPYVKTDVEVTGGRAPTLEIRLVVGMEKQQVTVTGETNTVSVSPTNYVGAIVLKGEDLEALSDNPDDLADDLQALAGPSAGPNGGQIFIDGFTGGQLPPKSSIREIRVNQNPFSAEFDRLGFGRIEIFTKPGTDKFRGQAFFNFGDALFNSRNPFTPSRPAYQAKQFEGNMSGPLNHKASFFVSMERRDQDEAAAVNALTLDSSLNPTLFSQAVLTPIRTTELTPRLDYQLSSSNTLVARYSYHHRDLLNQGIGVFSLPSVAVNTLSTEHTLQLTDTVMLNASTVNETRFQYSRDRMHETGNNSQPTVSVLDAFTGGGASLGSAADDTDHYELQNYTSLTRNKHMVRVGGRLRELTAYNSSNQDYNGLFTFTTLDAYRLTLLGLQNGQTFQQIRAAGGGASQFSITSGIPSASIGQFDLGLFAQDDWRVRQNFSLSLGLRYETQDNISDHADLAPRVGFAWALGGGKTRQAKTVIRGGTGIFYDRFDSSYTLQALRLNGVTQEQFLVPFPNFYIGSIPSLDTLAANRLAEAIRKVDPNLRAPYINQSALSLERQLPKNITVGLTYAYSHGVHTLRSRNINAPLPGSGLRPFGNDVGNIYQYEASGIFNQRQLIARVNARVNRSFSLTGFYMLNKAQSNTDGAGTFPANSYDLTTEYSRAAFDVRHRAFIMGSFVIPLGLRFSPFIVISSGRPFNITLGRDLNGDSIFNDRPAFAADLTLPSVRVTPWGAFDTNPQSGATIIPRNFGNGPGQFSVNLRVSKTIGFGTKPGTTAMAKFPGGGGPGNVMIVGGPGGAPHGGGGGGERIRGGPGGGPGGFFGGETNPNKRYNVTVSVSARNLFNTVNLASPIGNLSSPLFGMSNAIMGGFGPGGGSATANRRVELQVRFSF